MGPPKSNPSTETERSRAAWRQARRQHGVLTHEQLAALGFSAKAIKHRLATGRLHPVHRGVYAVGRRELSREGRWMAALLACGPGAALSHGSAAAAGTDAAASSSAAAHPYPART